MKVLTKTRTSEFFIFFTFILCFLLAVICMFIRIKRLYPRGKEVLSVLSVKPFFPQGQVLFSISDLSKSQSLGSPALIGNKDFTQKTSNSEYSSSEIPQPPLVTNENEEDKHNPNEKTFRIIESQFGQGGLKYENFCVKNTSGVEIDIAKELTSKPDFCIKNSTEPQVLIYHTHTSESYLKKDEGFYYESYYPRSTDSSRNVTRVGEEITKQLIKHGISTIHDVTYHDSPTYKGSYSRSCKTIKENLEKYPSIKVTIDIHRDSMGSPENGKVKPTFKINGNKAAQIMIVAGCDKDGSVGFPDWEYNLRLALRLQKKCETMFPGLTRPMSFGNFRYNMNLSHGAMLIEVGSDVNTLNEAVYSGTLVGEALAGVLNDLKK